MMSTIFPLHPQCILLTIYHLIAKIIVLLITFIHSYLLVFNIPKNDIWTYTLIFIDIYLLFYIILNLNTSYYNRYDQLIVNTSIIRTRYIKSWFFFDIIICFPYNITSLIFPFPQIFELLKIIMLFRIPSLLNSDFKPNFVFYINSIISYNTLLNISNSIKLMFTYILVGHLFSCIWIKFTYNQSFYYEECFYNSLIDKNIISNINIYSTVFYFILISSFTTGYGDFFPITTEEKTVLILIIICLFSFHIYFLSSISQLIQKNLKINLHKRKILNSLLFHYKNYEDEDINRNIHKYICFSLDNSSKGMTFNDLFEIIPLQLKHSIIYEINKNILFKYTPFDKHRHAFGDIVEILNEEFLYDYEELINQGQVATKMYFIKNGSIMCYNKDTTIILSYVNTNNVIGEFGFFTGNKRKCSAMSITYTWVMYLTRKSFYDYFLSKTDEDELKEGQNVIKDLFNKDKSLKEMNINCYFCGSLNHMINDCIDFVNKGNKYYFTTLNPKLEDKINKDMKRYKTLNEYLNKIQFNSFGIDYDEEDGNSIISNTNIKNPEIY